MIKVNYKDLEGRTITDYSSDFLIVEYSEYNKAFLCKNLVFDDESGELVEDGNETLLTVPEVEKMLHDETGKNHQITF